MLSTATRTTAGCATAPLWCYGSGATCKGKNQSWKIQPLGTEADAPPPACGIQEPPVQETRAGYCSAETYPAPAAGQWHHGHQPGPGYQQPYPQQPSAGYGYAYGVGVERYGYLAPPPSAETTVRILCRANEEYNLTVRDGTACLAPANPADDFQHWVKDMRRSTSMMDEEGHPGFAW
uniref:PH domain-containing protein n=1 Tax=Aegilops tauschii subsp. strangulata TaxID=200361 RepID=A0A453A7T7_AEGTS